MLISCDVSRSYRGAPEKRVRIRTGLGGGDCGFHFEVGEHYLVYASAGDSGQLSTGICSGTALLEESQANLSYLRGEPVVPQSLERHTPLEGGKLCGRVVGDDLGFADRVKFSFSVSETSLLFRATKLNPPATVRFALRT